MPSPEPKLNAPEPSPDPILKTSKATDASNVEDVFASLLIDVPLDTLFDSVVHNVVRSELIFNLIA